MPTESQKCWQAYDPDMIVSGKYNLIATMSDWSAILWKDGQYYIVSANDADNPEPISEPIAMSYSSKGPFVHPIPIPLEDLSEWRDIARLIDIPVVPLEEANKFMGILVQRDYSREVSELRKTRVNTK